MLNLTTTRFLFFILLTLNSFITTAQKVECRNDSIFINSFYINAFTSKVALDSILNAKGKIKQESGLNKPTTTERMTVTSYIYDKLGLIFKKYDYDSTKLSIAIKLNNNSNRIVDMKNMATQLFKGDLFFAGIHMNEIKLLEQLQELKGYKLTYHKQPINVPGYPLAGIYAVTIDHQNSSIYVLSDIFTDTVTCVFIN